ncbi:saccharopine dehydrogenase NADP-binding domain-containing protein [Myxococcus sp. AM009]|uniref:saccharopine dehydrogenase NADP-binding domain-containing protein n=1 Tax=Myxococcus sp. AM009 TaxID=2745137 RepID=UPI001C3E0985
MERLWFGLGSSPFNEQTGLFRHDKRRTPLTASNPSPGIRHAFAVFGANGHTGRFVVAELLRRGHRVVAMGRDFARLSAAFEQTEVELRAACLEDSDALGRALAGVEVIVNCAGPFLDTAEALVEAALRAKVHYLDVSAEQASAQALFERFSVAAKDAGILVLPAVGFYGGFADLLATVATDGWVEAAAVSIGIALDAWWPTPGTRNTGRRNTVPRVVIEAGKLTPKGAAGPAEWHFPALFGRQEMAEVPFSEIVLIHRQLRAMQVRTWLNTGHWRTWVILPHHRLWRPTRPGAPRSGSWWRCVPAGVQRNAASQPAGATSTHSPLRWWSKPLSVS